MFSAGDNTVCLQALARACVVTASEQPPETKQVTLRLVEQLLFLVNPENELAHLDVPGPVSVLCVTLWFAMSLPFRVTA